MALTLTDDDLTRLREAQETLLSVPTRPSVSDWCAEVVDRTGALLRNGRTMIVLAHNTGLELLSQPALTPFLAPFGAAIEGVESGTIQFEAGQLNESQVMRRKLGLEVWSNRLLVDLYGSPMEATGWFYHDFIEPAGVAHGGGLTVYLPRGEAMLMTTPGAFGEDWLDLFGMLLPAFKAAVHHLQLQQVRGEVLLRTLDALPRPLWLMDAEAVELHRNAALRALLETEPEADRIVEEARALTLGTLRLRTADRKSQPDGLVPVGERVVRLAGGRYRLRALYLDPDLDGGDAAVLVEVESLTPRLPTARELRTRFGLTPRQAEVTLLLARGASNREVADELGISPHTVRSHAEMIFVKLNVHTRKALALKLVE